VLLPSVVRIGRLAGFRNLQKRHESSNLNVGGLPPGARAH
jgi:hypothetical protein